MRRLSTHSQFVVNGPNIIEAKSPAIEVSTNPSGGDLEARCATPVPQVPPSPHLSIDRLAYNLPDFNKTFDALGGKRKTENGIKSVAQSVKPSCSIGSWKKRMKSFLPITDWLFHYNIRNDLVADIIVGITVAVFQVPQSMGYCLIAHVPPVHGLYTAFFPPLVYALLGTSRHSAVGAFAIVSGVMTGNLVVQTMNQNGYDIDFQKTASDVVSLPTTATFEYSTESAGSSSTTAIPQHHNIPDLLTIEVAVAASFWMGIYMFFFGVFRLGFISIYLSEQLISGFATAASIYVFTSQLRYLFGVNYPYRSGLYAIINSYIDVFRQFDEISIPTAIISVITIAVLVFFKTYVNEKIKKRGLNVPFPIELFVVIGGTAISHALDLEHTYGVNIVGEIKRGLPAPSMPRYDVFLQVWSRSIPLAAVGYTITLSVGKLFGAKHGYEVDANQELVALGATNLVGSCFSCIPSAASLPRSAVQEAGGGRTQMVSLINCASLLVVLLFLGSLLEKLPNCVLGSIIAVALISLLAQIKEFNRYWKVSKLDGTMWLTAFLGVIILDVDLGLYFGLVFSLLVLIYKSSRPKTYLLGTINKTDVYVPINKYGSSEEIEKIKVYQFCGPLHFSSIEFFKKDIIKKTSVSVSQIIAERKKQMVKKESENGNVFAVDQRSNCDFMGEYLPTHIIIDCSMFSYIDAAGISTLKKTVQEYESVGIVTFLASCAAHVIQMLDRDNFFVDVPPNHVYISVHDAVLHAVEEQKGSPSVAESCALAHMDDSDSISSDTNIGVPVNPFTVNRF